MDPAEIIETYGADWMSLNGVQAVGQSELDGEIVIKIYSSGSLPETIPAEINGIRIVSQHSGTIHKQDKTPGNR